MIQVQPSSDNPSREGAECFIGTTAAIVLALGAAATAGSTAYAAHSSSDAAQHAADTQTQAANHAADTQKSAADDALKFQQQQAENDFRNSEATRAANYQQYLNRYHGAQSLGATIGFNLPEAAAYVPQTDPNYTNGQTPLPSTATTPNSSTTTPTGGTGTGATGGNPGDPNYIGQQLASVYRSLGVSPTGRGTGPTDIAYYADQVAKTGGWTPQNAGYWTSRIQSDLRGGGAGAGGGQGAQGFSGPTLGSVVSPSQFAPQMINPQSATLAPPGYTPFQPTLGNYMGGR